MERAHKGKAPVRAEAKDPAAKEKAKAGAQAAAADNAKVGPVEKGKAVNRISRSLLEKGASRCQVEIGRDRWEWVP
jgi:hypothetical protein